MTTISLPKPIVSFLKAVQNHDSGAFASNFDTNATLTNEGATKVGRTAIEDWATKSLFAHNVTISEEKSTVVGSRTILQVLMDGDYKESHGITEPFTMYLDFKLGASSILSLVLTSHEPIETMLAVSVAKSNPENPLLALSIGRQPVPTAPEGWVKVKMAASSLNWHDIFTLMGVVSPKTVFPIIIGCDGCGTLEDGTEVVLYPVMGDLDFRGDETLDPNRHVLSEQVQGTLAEYVIVPRRNALPRPAELSIDSAAVLGIAWLTAYRMLFTQSRLRAGQIMLVQGSSGGTATALIQMGSAAGMRVWSTGRTAEKRELAVKLGAERTFEPGQELPEKVDAVFDVAGTSTWEHTMRSVKAGGTVLTSGVHSGTTPVPLTLQYLFVEQITLKGVYTGTREEFKDLISFVVAKKIIPHVGQILPLSKADEGFKNLKGGITNGKIVLKM